jgi:Glu-tRNA(Gln) amidotransferase subunit E-like FAD-binding protein
MPVQAHNWDAHRVPESAAALLTAGNAAHLRPLCMSARTYAHTQLVSYPIQLHMTHNCRSMTRKAATGLLPQQRTA